ncbi:MAG: hypothetical protein FJ291_25345 [Planctomycetes bacterium]|nr:hypothetical protein [Planctomycetota bacterium]
MATIRRPFHVYLPGDPPRPMLQVRIINPASGLAVAAWGLVDTGADDCALPASYAPLLGHNLQAGLRRTVGTGNGDTDAYAHTTRIEVFAVPLGRRTGRPVFTIPDTLIDFLPNLPCVLLGVSSFLSDTILRINYPKQYFTVRKP